MPSIMKRIDAFLFLTRCLSSGANSGPHRDRLAEEIAGGRIGWERVIELGSHYWMTLALFQELREKRLLDLLPAELLDYFHQIHDANAARNRGILAHVRELAAILNRIGVEPVLLKGACHLASGLYPDPAARFMSDIDILVDNDRALECWRVLVSSGYRSDSACANDRVECIPLNELPELARKGRTGVVELHRGEEWRHMLSAATLYEDAQPIAVGGAIARIPNPASRLIFTLGHAYVHHEVGRRAGMPLRDLYDAALLLRRHAVEISWPRVIESFEHGGEIEALRAGWMMLRSLLQPVPPFAIEAPRLAWLYRQRCRFTVTQPGIARICSGFVDNAVRLRCALYRTPEGATVRRDLFTPSGILGKLRAASRLRSLPRENRWR
jgi:hypothetical protein